MANIKSFIHANAIVAERVGSETFNFYGGFPYSDIIGLPRGWGKMYLGRTGQNVWFHAAVPSPAVTSSVRVLLDGVFVFFRTHDGSGSSSSSKNCYMSNLDVWDGSNLVKQFASLHSLR